MQVIPITIGKKAQIVIPKKAREAIGIKEGSKATLVYEKGRGVILGNAKQSMKLLKGLGKEMWAAAGGADKYLKAERASWNRD